MIQYILFFITLQIERLIALDDCQPFGARVSIGYYYTNQQNKSDLIDIVFNTNSICDEAVVLIREAGTQEDYRIIYEIQNNLFDLGQIYKDDPIIKYSYQTFIHRVQLNESHIQEGLDYEYIIQGLQGNQIGPYNIKIPQKQQKNDVKNILFFGDIDTRWLKNESKYTMDWFINEVETNRKNYDILIFNGDMAYDLESLDGKCGEYFLRNISQFTPYWPLMVTPGNHDKGNNSQFDYYKQSFYTPELQNINTDEYYFNFYSFDLGYAHFISFNPYMIVYGYSDEIKKQELIELMRQDLIQAQQNRDSVPWIIVYSHYPMYCSGYQDKQCYNNFIAMKDFEDLYKEYKVDMLVAGHQHNYERDAPTYRNKTSDYKKRIEDLNQNYIEDAQSPVYIVEGVAGNDYYMPPEIYNNSQYTVSQTVNVGMGKLSILNKTHIIFQQIEAKNNNIADYVYVIKNYSSSIEQKNNKKLIIIIGISVAVGFILFSVSCYLIIKYKKQKLKKLQDIQVLDQEDY